MKLYTEADLLKAIEWACSYQKGTDYQTAGRYLIPENKDDLNNNIELLLNDLADSDSNAHKEIDLKDIFE